MSLNAIDLSKTLVKKWMTSYMLKNNPNAEQIADDLVSFLVDHNAFKSHSRRVDLAELQSRDVVAKDIRDVDPSLWLRIEEAWYAIQHTFEGTGLFKCFENSKERGFFRIIQLVVQAVPSGRKSPVKS